MGCGASRDAPVAATLTLALRVEKERDDASLAPVQLKRLGVGAYDEFFADFETAVNNVVALNNGLFDALCDVKATLAFAVSPDPEYNLQLELTTEGVRSGPQLLLDVLYADSSIRPQPLEARHLLASRPAISDADAAVGAAAQALSTALQSTAPGVTLRLAFDEAKQHFSAAGSGAPAVQQPLARTNAALAAFRKAAPGLKVHAIVVPTSAPGAVTFAWRLVPCPAAGTSATTDIIQAPIGQSDRPTATPLRLACAQGAAAILDAATTVAHQAAAVAAAVAATVSTATAATAAAATAAASASGGSSTANVANAASTVARLRVDGGRRIDAVPDEVQAAAMAASAIAAAAAATCPVTPSRASIGALRALSLTRSTLSAPSGVAGVPATTGGGCAAAGCATAAGGVNVSAAADEATAALRRAVASANHALFRLSKCASAGASGGPEGTALRSREGSGSAIPSALKLVMQAAVQAARQAAVTATSNRNLDASSCVAAADGDSGDGEDPGGGSTAAGGYGTSLPATDLLSADPYVTVASENGSAISGSTMSGAAASSAYGGLLSKGVGAEGLTPGWSWMWSWGIQPRVIGLTFPDCLPPRARAVHDAVAAAVAAAQAATDQLPLVQREVQQLVEEAEAVFRANDVKLSAAGRDMVTAGRLRASLDRNANTISASPALAALLQAAVAELVDDLKRGAEEMLAVLYGGPSASISGAVGGGGGGMADLWDSGRPSGNRSAMEQQLSKAAAVAAASAKAAAAAVAAANKADSSALSGSRRQSRNMDGDGDNGGGEERYSAQSRSVADPPVAVGGGADWLSGGGMAPGAPVTALPGRYGGGLSDSGAALTSILSTGSTARSQGEVPRRVVMLPPLAGGQTSLSGGQGGVNVGGGVSGGGESLLGCGELRDVRLGSQQARLPPVGSLPMSGAGREARRQ